MEFYLPCIKNTLKYALNDNFQKYIFLVSHIKYHSFMYMMCSQYIFYQQMCEYKMYFSIKPCKVATDQN